MQYTFSACTTLNPAPVHTLPWLQHMLNATQQPAASAVDSADGSGKEVISKVMVRMTLFGALPPSILPMLLSVRVKVDLPKTADRKLLRVVNYLIQLAAGEGSAGTVVPFSTLIGRMHRQGFLSHPQASSAADNGTSGTAAACVHQQGAIRVQLLQPADTDRMQHQQPGVALQQQAAGTSKRNCRQGVADYLQCSAHCALRCTAAQHRRRTNGSALTARCLSCSKPQQQHG